jgi:hypothetical protein
MKSETSLHPVADLDLAHLTQIMGRVCDSSMQIASTAAEKKE